VGRGVPQFMQLFIVVSISRCQDKSSLPWLQGSRAAELPVASHRRQGSGSVVIDQFYHPLPENSLQSPPYTQNLSPMGREVDSRGSTQFQRQVPAAPTILESWITGATRGSIVDGSHAAPFRSRLTGGVPQVPCWRSSQPLAPPLCSGVPGYSSWSSPLVYSFRWAVQDLNL
jgi:hypothetical protein